MSGALTMNGHHATRSPHSRAGISLLEVLISIGILSIGLLATLSLIPAGRTYMKKASVDDRAAALVPNAYATMTRLGLMSQNALSWTDVPDADFSNPESGLVIRDAGGGDIFNYSPIGHTYNAFAPESLAPWVITSTNAVYAVSLYTQPVYSLDAGATFESTPSPDYIRGTTQTSASGLTVTLTTTGTHGSGPGTPSAGPTGSTVSNPTTGAWSYAVSPQPLSVPQMDIETSGPNLGKPKSGTYYFVDYSTTAVYTPPPPPSPPVQQSANPNPSSWRQYGRLRQNDDRRGRARITYSLPSNATDINNSPDSALLIPVTRLENATAQGRGTIARSVTRKIKGTLWRLQAGTREGDFTRRLYFARNGTTLTSIDPAVFDDRDITENAGDTWVAGPTNHEDVDWYKFRVDAGDMLEISWNDYNGVLLADSGYKFPLYLNTTNVSGGPMPSITALNTGNSRTYTIPNDGYVITRAQLRPYNVSNPDADIPTLVNTFGDKDTAKNSPRMNPAYDFTVRFSRTDRVVVVDPLMASRFDKVLALSGPTGDFDPRYLRRHRFADFQQTYAQSGSPRAFVIPRLNWQKYSSSFVDTMVAVSEKLFHDQDNIAVDLPPNAEDAPTQIFDLAATNSPGRRQSEGKMSWLLMLQPEDAGPVATNWIAGRYFDVSLVIFENRKLPPLVANPPLDGEYAFNSTWNDLDGMITVTVPGTLGLDEDDVRDLFKTGAWILLAPQINYDASPIESTQRLDWIRIQTAQIEPGANGAVIAKVLPESEPADNILYRGLNPPNTTSFPIVVLAYQGVVAVVNKSVQLAP